MQLRPARLDLPEVENLVDESQPVDRRATDLLEVGEEVVGPALAQLLAEHLRVARDGVEGRPHLVAHVGDEAAPALGGRLGRFAGVGELPRPQVDEGLERPGGRFVNSRRVEAVHSVGSFSRPSSRVR